MMGPRQRCDGKLFYTQFNLDQRIRVDHPLRKVLAAVDFDFVRPLVKPLYGRRGHPSVDPVVLLKLMFLLFYENVSSERALMERLPERLDWLWFCGYDLDDPIPDHSVISKARKRWGVEVFSELFGQILGRCLDAGLVDGRRVHADASVLSAAADKTRLSTVVRLTGHTLFQQLDQTSPLPVAIPTTEPATDSVPTHADESAASTPPTLEPSGESSAETDASLSTPSAPLSASSETIESDDVEPSPPLGSAVSPTDPEARLTRKNGQVILGYKDHRIVDDRCGIITSTTTTDAARADGQMLMEGLHRHQFNTGQSAGLVGADKSFGTAENYKALLEQEITPCIPHQHRRHLPDKFPHHDFIYQPATDQYRCPAGQLLTCVKPQADGTRRYRTDPGVCADCPLRTQCTEAAAGRQITRHADQDWIDQADRCLTPSHRRSYLRRRSIRAEGSFADAANNHGYKRARWRGLKKMTIQNLLIAAIQNLRKLLKARPAPAPNAPGRLNPSFLTAWTSVGLWIRCFRRRIRPIRPIQPM